MSQKLPWGRLGAEFVVIVLGVLVALTADAWRDTRAERAEELEYLDALEQDFTENQGLLATHIEDAERIRDANLSLLDTDYTRASREEVRLLLVDALLIVQFRPVMATYQDMVNSGDIRLLSSDSLRVALARFESRAAIQNEVSGWAWDHWIAYEEPLMIEARALTGLYPEYGGIELPDVEYGVDLGRLSQPDFSEVLSSRVWIQQDLVTGGGLLTEGAELILRLVAESRGERPTS